MTIDIIGSATRHPSCTTSVFGEARASSPCLWTSAVVFVLSTKLAFLDGAGVDCW